MLANIHVKNMALIKEADISLGNFLHSFFDFNIATLKVQGKPGRSNI